MVASFIVENMPMNTTFYLLAVFLQLTAINNPQINNDIPVSNIRIFVTCSVG
jgi:hypothetical protein